MPKSNMSSIPGMNAMTDTLEFVKNLWGGMNVPGVGIPGMVMPTLSVDEINKQITDLKAVESWLNMNMNMLRGTIQALEVQGATIATLRSMSETLGATAKSHVDTQPGGFISPFSPAPQPTAEASKEQPQRAGAWWQTGNESRIESTPAPTPETQHGSASQFDAGNLASQMVNPAAWWNLLQDQFAQAVNASMPPEPKKTARKPAAKSSHSTARKRKSSPAA
ncbi:MAG TPA: PhaM family polyhydroxyalkanoate granule multifunctional regulatory protein [Paucimonas sp.]|nr:PhaM family polyhydroxyalkanoate granule multifunctional regulatory protein [Paucimonas sp.]HJW56446.1 PhaM family polyhydroxyalkanoate granule multifunctional regulatory protein [Burkholderiaceae bacterium]